MGLRRAVGATKGHVGAQFITESLIVSALGGLGGVALGAVTTAVYATSRSLPFVGGLGHDPPCAVGACWLRYS